MYTETTCELLSFAEEKGFLDGGDAVELGSSQWDTTLNRFMKARRPGFMLAQSATELFSRLNVGNYTNYPSDKDIRDDVRCDVVCSFSYIQSKIDKVQAWNTLHTMTSVGGVMIVTAPLGYSDSISTVTLNEIVFLTKRNNYEVPYFGVSTADQGFKIKLNSKKQLGNAELKEILYKFKETSKAHVSVIFKKTHDDVFKY